MDRNARNADEIFFAALEIEDPEARKSFLDTACGQDAGLRGRVERRPDDEMCLQSLGWAFYRAGDWKGSIETLGKQPCEPLNGDFFATMAYWQLGDEAIARKQFDRIDKWMCGYIGRCEEREKSGQYTYPFPDQVLRIRAEAAALPAL